MKNCLFVCLLFGFLPHGRGQQPDTFLVHFAFNDPKISKQAGAFIDNLIFKDKLIHGQKLMVLGYADYVGDNAYNDTLSATRAKNVRNYLISSGFDQKDIKLCMGKGKIDHAPVKERDGIAADRKVQIIIDNEPHADTQLNNGLKSKRDTAFASLSRLKVNSTFPLNILFENISSLMLSKSYPVLKQLLDFMVRNPSVRIQIEGHICCMDPKQKGDGYDINNPGPLSVNRAKAIYDYLVKNGIRKERLNYIGLGGTVPAVYPELTDEDQEKNRRVEIRILSK